MRSSTNPFAAFNLVDLTMGVGGLQLLPENANRLFRLDYLAGRIAEQAVPTDWRPTASPEQWEQLVNSPLVIPSEVFHQEDPFNYPFTESFTFSDGSHTVLGGLAEAGPFLARLVSDAIFRSDPSPGTREFQRWASRLFLATLHLGDEIARRVGLGRGVRPESGGDGRCVIPPPERFGQLKQAVTFTVEELASVLGVARCTQADLDALILQPRLNSTPAAASESPVIAQPILRLPDRYVVLAPGNLLTAARHAVVSRAVADGFGPALSAAYRNTAFASVYDSLHRIGMQCRGATPPARQGPFAEGVFSFDTDKLAHVVLTTDPLTAWDADQVFGEWDASDLAAAIPALQSAARTKLFDPRNRLSDILHLTVVVGIGRGHYFGYNPLDNDPRCRRLNVSAETLDVLSWLSDTNPLTLWQFAQAGDVIDRRARVVAFDPLDEYGFYRSHRCSYYATDDGTPDMMSLAPDFAGPLRCEAHDRADRLAVIHPESGNVVEVFNSHSDPSVPIHCTVPDRGMPDGLHVAGLPLSVWVTTPGAEPDDRYAPLHFQFADMVAYWVWQLTPGLTPDLGPVAGQVEHLVIELELRPAEAWFANGLELVSDNTLYARSVSPDRVRLTIGPGIVPQLASADNAGERQVVRALLGGLREWGQRIGISALGNRTDRELSELVDRYAPLGLKKKLLMLNSDRHPELNRNGLPP